MKYAFFFAACLTVSIVKPSLVLAAPEHVRFAAAMADDSQTVSLDGLSELERDLWILMQLRDRKGDAVSSAAALDLVARHDDWPLEARAQKTIESMLDGSELKAREFFEAHAPVSEQGFAIALSLGGVAAQKALDEAWPSLELTAEAQNSLILAHSDMLRALYWRRADALLWANMPVQAAQMAHILDTGQRAQLAARLAYLTDDPRAGALDVGAGGTPGLARARFGWLYRKGDYRAAGDLMMARKDAAAFGEPARWAKARLALARRSLRENDWMRGYALLKDHGLTSENGADFAEAEWLAGYVALTEMEAPSRAAEHFARLRDGVVSPVSKARAHYWLARAQRRAGNAAAATEAFTRAAQFQTTFYGQLAAEDIGASFPRDLIEGHLGRTPLIADDPIVRALDALVAVDARGLSYRFARKIGKNATARTLKTATARLLAREDYYLSLRVAKDGARRGHVISEALYPLHPLAGLEGVNHRAMALAIARQESEFRTDAGSSAGALGLMQLMPQTAQRVSQRLGLEYREGLLTQDWSYNSKLGTAYLDELRDEFGDSPLLVAAAYNAGPGRVREWIGRFGDPRREETDPIAWAEAIPFAETRNYVMRVIEAMRPYEARLTGDAPKRTISQMLRGQRVFLRPKSRSDVRTVEAASPTQAAVETATSPQGAAPQANDRPKTAIRPRLRPAGWPETLLPLNFE